MHDPLHQLYTTPEELAEDLKKAVRGVNLLIEAAATDGLRVEITTTPGDPPILSVTVYQLL